MIRRRFLTVSRTNGAHTNSSMPDLNKQANKGIPPVLFRGRLRVPRGLCLCVTCQTSFGGTRTGHADHHVETNGVKLFVGLEFVLTPHRTWAQAQAQAHCRSSLRAVCVQGSVLYLLHYMLGDGGIKQLTVQCSAVLDARSRREAARLGSHHP